MLTCLDSFDHLYMHYKYLGNGILIISTAVFSSSHGNVVVKVECCQSIWSGSITARK